MEKHRLHSWKEIATYLGRCSRTVQRWEKEEGLPVHRLFHKERGSVYAVTPELERWLAGRREHPSFSRQSHTSDVVEEQTGRN